MPVDTRVWQIFWAISPLFPTPVNITTPRQSRQACDRIRWAGGRVLVGVEWGHSKQLPFSQRQRMRARLLLPHTWQNSWMGR